MTSNELRQILGNVATTLTAAQATLTPGMDDEIVQLLTKLQTEPMLAIVVAFVHAAVPGMTEAQVVKNIKIIVNLVQQFKQMESSGEIDKAIAFCHKLESHPLLLTMLALLM